MTIRRHAIPALHASTGGGTTLAMVVGWNSIESAGYHYLLDPLLLDVVLLIGAAVVFNSLFPWRRYPVGLARYLSARRAPPTSVSASPAETGPLARGHLETALKTLNTTLDISEEDLEEIYRLPTRTSRAATCAPRISGSAVITATTVTMTAADPPGRRYAERRIR